MKAEVICAGDLKVEASGEGCADLFQGCLRAVLGAALRAAAGSAAIRASKASSQARTRAGRR